MKQYLKKKELPILFGIAFLASVYGILILPQSFQQAVGQTIKNGNLCVVKLVCIIAILFLTAFLFYKGKKDLHALGRFVITMLILGLGAVCISLISGILAVIFFAVLQNVLTLGQIKGIIDFLITAMVVLSMPFMISVFWQVTMGKEKILDVVLKGLSLTSRAYLRLLIFVALLFGVGMLITTAFHFLADNWTTRVIKVLLFTLVGTISLLVSQQECSRKENYRREK